MHREGPLLDELRALGGFQAVHPDPPVQPPEELRETALPGGEKDSDVVAFFYVVLVGEALGEEPVQDVGHGFLEDSRFLLALVEWQRDPQREVDLEQVLRELPNEGVIRGPLLAKLMQKLLTSSCTPRSSG